MKAVLFSSKGNRFAATTLFLYALAFGGAMRMASASAAPLQDSDESFAAATNTGDTQLAEVFQRRLEIACQDVSHSGSLSTVNPTQEERITQKGERSTCNNLKSYPGSTTEDGLYTSSPPFAPATFGGCVTVNFNSGTCGDSVIAVAYVEGLHNPHRHAAAYLDVNAATELLAVQGHIDRHLVVAAGFINSHHNLPSHVGSNRDRRAEFLEVEVPADGKDRVANGFGIQTTHRVLHQKNERYRQRNRERPEDCHSPSIVWAGT